MENTVSKNENQDKVELWEGFIYLAFFIFANLYMLPNMPEKVRIHYYPIEMLIYGTIGIFFGILVYRLVKNSPEWVKILIVSVLYLIIFIRLIVNWQVFTVIGN